MRSMLPPFVKSVWTSVSPIVCEARVLVPAKTKTLSTSPSPSESIVFCSTGFFRNQKPAAASPLLSMRSRPK